MEMDKISKKIFSSYPRTKAMQSDDVIWSIIADDRSGGHCSYRVKTDTQAFCRNQYNVTGLCNRTSCPLANSRYATVREESGVLYLCMKTIERAHSPANMWEKVRLSNDYEKALQQVDENLIYWPKYLIHKCKQRLTKITQYLIKIRKLRTMERGKLVTVNRTLEHRERNREGKALRAANIEKELENELVSRLKSKAYGDAPLNVNEEVWQKILDSEKLAEEGDLQEDETDEEYEEELEREFVSDLEESDEDVEDWMEDLMDEDEEDNNNDKENQDDGEGPSEEEEAGAGQLAPSKGKRRRDKDAANGRKKSRRQQKIEVEYENEVARPNGVLAST